MKISKNKLCFLILLGCTMGITIFLLAISLLTEYIFLQYTSCAIVFGLSFYAVKTIHNKTFLFSLEKKQKDLEKIT